MESITEPSGARRQVAGLPVSKAHARSPPNGRTSKARGRAPRLKRLALARPARRARLAVGEGESHSRSAKRFALDWKVESICREPYQLNVGAPPSDLPIVKDVPLREDTVMT